MRIAGHGAEKYVTGRLLASSTDRGWTHLLAERRSHGAGELPSLIPRETEIAIMLRGRTLVERQGGGMRQRTFATRGTIWLCPSGIREEYINVAGEISDCLHIFLPGRPFADTVLQDLDIDPSRVNLRYESIAHDSFIEPIAERILAELDAETSSGRLLVETMSNTLSAYLIQRYSETGVRLRISTTVDKPLDGRRLSRVMDFVDAQISGDLAVSDMAKVACLSPAHFARSFKATTGRPPHEFVSERRLDLAKKMLSEGRHSTAEIAHATGFSSQANFARAFRKVASMTPSQYREQVKVGPLVIV